jgi:hypothetical protein
MGRIGQMGRISAARSAARYEIAFRNALALEILFPPQSHAFSDTGRRGAILDASALFHFTCLLC